MHCNKLIHCNKLKLLKKIIYTIIYGIIGISFSQTIILRSHLIKYNKNTSDKYNNMVKNIIYKSLPFFYQNCTDSPLYYKGRYKPSNKIDIVVCNHLFMYDSFIPISIIRQTDNRNIYLVFDKKQLLYPGYGLIFLNTPDFKTNNGIEKDTVHILDTINNKLDDIDSGIILVFPEGDYFSNKNYNNSISYSKKNSLHQFNNLLYPKMKGLYTISNRLKQLNKLGNIIDMTICLENFKNKDCNIYNILTHDIGRTNVIITSYKSNYNINTYDEFKEYFIKIWKKKDTTYNINRDNNYRDNNYRDNNYQYIKPILNKFNKNIIIFIVFIFSLLVLLTFGTYYSLSFIASYYIIFKYFKQYC